MNHNASHSRENSRTAMIVTLALLLLAVVMTTTSVASGQTIRSVPLENINQSSTGREDSPATSGGWAKTYGCRFFDVAFSIQQTSDGGYIVGGWTYLGGGGANFWVFKLDDAGSVVWQKSYGGNRTSEAFFVKQTSDGGYIVAGWTSSFDSGITEAWVLRIDSNGSIIWQKAYGGSGSSKAYSCEQTSDGGFIVAGGTASSGSDFDFWVFKLDSVGSVTWQKTYGGDGADCARSVQQTSDGGYIVAGDTRSFGAGGDDVWVLKLDSTGGVVWQRTYGGSSNDYGLDVRQTSDGGYIVAGRTGSFGAGGDDVWVLKLTSAGDMTWQKSYGGIGTDVAVSIQQTSDSGYTVAGWTDSFGAGFRDAWVLNLDPVGSVVWQNAYGGRGADQAYSVQQTSDRGHIVAGEAHFSDSAFGAWIIKLGANGAIAWDALSGASTTITNVTPADSSATTSATLVTPLDSAAIDQDTHATPKDTEAIVSTQAGGGFPIILIAGIVGVTVAVAVGAVVIIKKRRSSRIRLKTSTPVGQTSHLCREMQNLNSSTEIDSLS